MHITRSRGESRRRILAGPQSARRSTWRTNAQQQQSRRQAMERAAVAGGHDAGGTGTGTRRVGIQRRAASKGAREPMCDARESCLQGIRAAAGLAGRHGAAADSSGPIDATEGGGAGAGRSRKERSTSEGGARREQGRRDARGKARCRRGRDAASTWLSRDLAAACITHNPPATRCRHGHPGTVRASNYIQMLRFLLKSFFFFVFATPEKIYSLSPCPQAVP